MVVLSSYIAGHPSIGEIVDNPYNVALVIAGILLSFVCLAFILFVLSGGLTRVLVARAQARVAIEVEHTRQLESREREAATRLEHAKTNLALCYEKAQSQPQHS